MGRVQRFKILKTAISKYGAPVETAGNAFYKFNQYRLGKANLEIAGTERGDDEIKSLTPFGTDGDDKYVIQLSGRGTDTNLSANALSLSELGLAAASGDDVYNENFIPAKIKVKKNGTKTKKHPSKITGTPYTKVAGSVFTFPFGRKATTDRALERQAALYRLVENAEGNYSVTFTPERMYGGS